MILIIDNYDSFTYNLVQLVHQSGKSYQVYRNDALSLQDIRTLQVEKILISPGPGRPEDAGISEEVIRQLGPEIPILGVCLGHQAIGQVFGAKVTYAPSLMHGKTSEVKHDGKTIFKGVSDPFTATRYHSLVLEPSSIDQTTLEVTAQTPDGVVMGVRHRKYPIQGIQFHPESVLTVEGPKLIQNWIAS